MDFDFSTILYVFLGIVYFIFTGVNKNKKKAQAKPKKPGQSSPETVGPPPVNRRPTFEELLEEFTGQKTIEPEFEPVPVIQEVVAPIKAAKPVNKYPVTIDKKEPDKSSASMSTFEPYDEEEVEMENYADMFSDLDGAKRAFIASEVFQRRY